MGVAPQGTTGHREVGPTEPLCASTLQNLDQNVLDTNKSRGSLSLTLYAKLGYLDIFVAQVATADIHHIRNSDVGQQVKGTQDMGKRGGVSWVSCDLRRNIAAVGVWTASAISESVIDSWGFRKSDTRSLLVSSTNVVETIGKVKGLPLPPYLVQPGVV